MFELIKIIIEKFFWNEATKQVKNSKHEKNCLRNIFEQCIKIMKKKKIVKNYMKKDIFDKSKIKWNVKK